MDPAYLTWGLQSCVGAGSERLTEPEHVTVYLSYNKSVTSLSHSGPPKVHFTLGEGVGSVK